MLDKQMTDPSIYTDFQSLDKLHTQAVKNPQAAKKAVAQQFESILVQMMLHSMRDATKSMAVDEGENNEKDMYQDIYDKQLSLVIAQHGLGLAQAIEKNMDNSLPQGTASAAPANVLKLTLNAQRAPSMSAAPALTNTQAAASPVDAAHHTPAAQASFLQKIWPAAKAAASAIGVMPEVLLAQAALETDWGKKIIPNPTAGTSNNLFNIKADANWAEKSRPVGTLEEKNGILVKDKAQFKVYDSVAASFNDYAKLLKDNVRYADTLKVAHDPQKFVHSLQQAGYATDSHYGDKIMQIFGSTNFKNLLTKLQ